MITDKPNMGREQIFTELPLPSKVKEVTLQLIYKALFIIVKLLLDSRLNLVKISEGVPIQTKHKKFQQGGRGQRPNTQKPDNPIKGLDSIKIEDKPVAKVDEKKEDVPSSKEKPDQIKLGKEEKLEDVKVDPEKMETIEKGVELVAKKEDEKVTKPKPEETKDEKPTEKLKEGSVNKGGVNKELTSPRPEEPPAGQDGKSDEATNDTNKPKEE